MADPFDELLEEQKQGKKQKKAKPKRRGSAGGCLLNIISGILVAGTLGIVMVFALVFLNPQISFNPFPPPTQPILVLTNTPTPTPKGLLPSTWTPEPTSTDTPTITPTPTETPIPTDTPIPTANFESGTSFKIQEGSPTYETNSFHPNEGCNWLGVAGQVFDSEGNPVLGVLVEAGGELEEEEISGLTLTGMAQDYGEGGYEIVLRNAPIDTEGAIYVQLLDQANLPLTDKFYFQTYESCDSNLIKINFEQVVEE
jgi:hypothetical protein